MWLTGFRARPSLPFVFSPRSSAVSLLLVAAACWAQTPEALPPIQFNVPYKCADGNSWIIQRCEMGRKAEACYFYIINSNGQKESDRVIVRSQLTGMLKTCPPANAARAAALAASAIPPEIPKRPTDPPYLREMPVPERVLEVIKGANPIDTVARQIAALGKMERSVEHMMDRKRYRKTPDEVQVMYAYSYAAYQMAQAFGKSHTPEEVKTMLAQQSQYDLDMQLQRDVVAKLYTPGMVVQQTQVDAAFAAFYKARAEQAQRDSARMQAPEPAPAQNSGFARNDPGTLAARRCIELGGSELGCVGKGFMTGLFGEGLAGSLTGDLPGRTGLTMTGRYEAAGNAAVWFDTNSMSLTGCGKLVDDSHNYTVAKSGNRFAVSVQAQPKPFTLSLGPDGSLTGPGLIDITGRIITGYRSVWMQLYQNGSPVVGGSCGGACGHYEQVPIFAPKTERCSIGALRAAGPTGTLGSGISAVLGVVAGKSGDQAAREATKDLPDPGVRMIGTYGLVGGLSLEFSDASVVLDCSEAHVARKYTVENIQNQVVIGVKNGGSQFALTLQPNGSLSGTGTIEVTGRVATGSTPDGIAYAQRSARCALGNLSVKTPGPGAPGLFSAGLAGLGGGASAPSEEKAGTAVLSVSSGLPAEPGHPNPLGSVSMYLVKESFAAVAERNGVRPAQGQTVLQAWGAACEHQAPECTQSTTAIKGLIASRLRFDLDGRGSFSALPAGRYYVFGFILYQGHHLVWDFPVDLKNGANAAVLDQRNAFAIK